MKSTWLNILIFLVAAFGLGSCFSNEDPNAALNAEIKQIDSYLTTMGLADEVLYDNSTGMRFQFLGYGEGPPPHSGQDVKYTFSRTLLADQTNVSTGIVDDDIEDVVPQGVQYTLQSILEGTRVRVFMPSKYGYGANGTTGVPANSILIFDLILNEVRKSTAEIAQFQTDTAAIRDFIEEENIEGVVEHESGISYKIETAGVGPYPVVYDFVTFKYKLRLVNKPETVIQDNTLTDYSIFGLIDGLKIGLPQMREGTKVTFYIPSGLGYGKNGSGDTIPANANLIFEIELTNVPD